MKMGILSSMILLLLLTGCGRQATDHAPWAEYQMSASVSTNSILIGQPVELQVSLDHPADTTPRLPRLDEEGSPLIVQEETSATEPLGEGQARTRVVYRLTSFEVGDHLVSSNSIEFLRQGAVAHSNLFPFASFQVQSALTNDQAAAGNKDLADWPMGLPRLVIGIVAVAALAFAIAALVLWWIMKRVRRPAPAPRLPPAHVTALEAIARLKQKNYIEDEKREPFYIELSDIIRRYLEQRFGIHAPDQTTEEFIGSAATSHLLNTEQRRLTLGFLQQCDLVKFARANPGAEDMRATLGLAVDFINETRISERAVAA